MARNTRSSQLETRTARLKLSARWKPYTLRIGPGVRLGYRRNETSGSWSVLAADGKGGNWMKGFAAADDHEDANGETVLDFWKAQERARVLARGETGATVVNADKPIIVTDALDSYAADLETRGADAANVTRVRWNLPDALAKKIVASLTTRDLRQWRDALKKKASGERGRRKVGPKSPQPNRAKVTEQIANGEQEKEQKKTLAASSINRICNALRAALNLAADTDERIISRRAWEVGLQALPDATVARNVVLSVDQIRGIGAAAYGISKEFGLLVEVAATTGARIVSQIARLEAQDAQADRLMMPTSKKGRGQKKVTRRPVPIPEALAVRLREVARPKLGTAPLLTKPDGSPWRKSDHTRDFRRAVEAAKLDPSVVTIYAMRHSSITRQLLAGVPVRVVAVQHDTSIAQLEKHYSAFISDHSDAISRAAMLDLSVPAADNVVQFSKG